MAEKQKELQEVEGHKVLAFGPECFGLAKNEKQAIRNMLKFWSRNLYGKYERSKINVKYVPEDATIDSYGCLVYMPNDDNERCKVCCYPH